MNTRYQNINPHISPKTGKELKILMTRPGFVFYGTPRNTIYGTIHILRILYEFKAV